MKTLNKGLLSLLAMGIFSSCSPGELLLESSTTLGVSIDSQQLSVGENPIIDILGGVPPFTIESDGIGSWTQLGTRKFQFNRPWAGEQSTTTNFLDSLGKITPVNFELYPSAHLFGGGTISNTSIAGTLQDSSGNILIYGTVDGLIQGEANGLSYGTVHGTLGSLNTFAAKIDGKTGGILWLNIIGSGLGKRNGYEIDSKDNIPELNAKLLSNDDLIIAGNSDGLIPGTILGSQGEHNVFACRFKSNGQIEWSLQLGETNESTYSKSIFVDDNDNILFSGTTSGTIADEQVGVKGNENAYLLKLNSSGIKLWSKQVGTLNAITSVMFFNSSNSNYYLSGTTEGDLTGGDPLLGPGDPNPGLGSVYVISFSLEGNINWIRQLGAGFTTDIVDTKVNSDDKFYIQGASSFGDLTHDETEGTPYGAIGGIDIFIAKFSSDGTKEWLTQIGSSNGSSFLELDTTLFLVGDTNYDFSDIKYGVGSDSDPTPEPTPGRYGLLLSLNSSTGLVQYFSQIAGANGTNTFFKEIVAVDETLVILGKSTADYSNSIDPNITSFSAGDNSEKIIVAQYDFSGTLDVISLLGVEEKNSYRINVDTDNEIIVSGTSTEDLGGRHIGSLGTNSSFVSKISTSNGTSINKGEFLWSTQIHGGLNSTATSNNLINNTNNDLFFAGEFNDYGSIDGSFSGELGASNAFILKLNSEGELQ